MLYIALLKASPGTSQARIARRLAWQIPDVGAEAVAEYWLQTPDPAVIAVFKADHIGQMWAVFNDWDDFFEIAIYPAVTAQEGLEILKQMQPK
jgi:hypothetical protein